jgi:hypothetical protein
MTRVCFTWIDLVLRAHNQEEDSSKAELSVLLFWFSWRSPEEGTHLSLPSGCISGTPFSNISPQVISLPRILINIKAQATPYNLNNIGCSTPNQIIGVVALLIPKFREDM